MDEVRLPTTEAWLERVAALGPILEEDAPEPATAKGGWPAIVRKELYAAVDLRGQNAPPFHVQTWLTGEPDRKGKVVLVTFWASWCGKCREQLAELTALYARHRDQGFQLLSVSLDDKVTRAQDVVADLRIVFPVLRDDKKTVARLYDPDTMPLTIIVDHGGTVRHVHEGYRPGDEALYQSELAALLAE